MNTNAAEKIVSLKNHLLLLLKQSCNVSGLFFLCGFQQKAGEIVNGANQTAKNQDEETLIQVLGPDNPGRMRAMERNISKTK